MNDERQKLAEKLADETGLAILFVDENGTEVCLANNNSICEEMVATEFGVRQCSKFCGKAFSQAMDRGTGVKFECHAGLECVAVPFHAERPLVAILGRAFTKSENYHSAAQRALSGDWTGFDAERLFANVLMNGSSAAFEKAVKGAEEIASTFETFEQEESSVEDSASVPLEASQEEPVLDPSHVSAVETVEPVAEPLPTPVDEPLIPSPPPKDPSEQEAAVWKSLLNSLLYHPYRDACVAIVRFLHERYSLRSIAWLELHGPQFETIFSDGILGGRQFRVALRSDDERLLGALRDGTALELRSSTQAGEVMTVSLFPIAVGGEIRSALAIADRFDTEDERRCIAKFCQAVATEIEILRLRDEVNRRGLLANAVERFNRSLDKIDSDAFWADMLNISAELMQAERGSLMIFDENTREFDVVAAVGTTPSKLKSEKSTVGKRVAEAVLTKGNPIVVSDVLKAGLSEAPAERKYKSKSFISYPFRISEGKVGLLNVTDRVDGAVYTNLDLDLLNAIAPQFTVLINRATLISKAGEYQQLSVTDPLTGLLNRRYLRERLAEEVQRSNRSGQQMSFMMIDVDEFKAYNDKFGHAEGDKALQIVARCLKESLRGADVAVRFGGEEFSILLPQTPIAEGKVIAERIRQKIASTKFPNRQVTISVGIAGCCTKIKTSEDLIEAADKALYDAKKSGRNRVRAYDESMIVFEAEVVSRPGDETE